MFPLFSTGGEGAFSASLRSANACFLSLASCSDHNATFTGSISGTTLAVSSVTGTIGVGQGVGGVGIANGTKITGGSGLSWTVNNSQTIGSESMFAGGSWRKLDDWPSGWMTLPWDIEGDPTVYGEVYIASPSGNFLGMFN
jgi:hypothetical protein